ncbi:MULTISPECIES: hypothetical protein [unclassified Streptomyces]|uniref:hypothetical protein n=1 Tax=unclassified Streptomyces TaxID=2593676 RepID=UPI002DD92258|nr:MULTISPECIES: hypothetical protein [unclassified Streptomyces]WSD94459.1 hypothetical protein OG758_09970 [Streptomyces sp. NBC_01474]
MILTLNVAVLLAVIIYFRIRRRVEARSRSDQWVTVSVVLVFGVLIAPTEFGQGLLDVLGNVVKNFSASASP